MSVIYTFSPKIVIIAGPPAAGKSTLALKIAQDLGYAIIRLDEINIAIATKCNCSIQDLGFRNDLISEFTFIFLEYLRKLRYKNIVLEGCRISHAYIFSAFYDALYKTYGEYIILKCFYLLPADEIRQKYYALRQATHAKKYIKNGDSNSLQLLKQEQEKGYCQYLEPVLEGFEVVNSSDKLFKAVFEINEACHPDLPIPYEVLLKKIAESNTFNPFYQRIEVNNKIVIHGFTDSEISWKNILKCNIDFKGKRICDIGCMHGYFSFKIEELGGIVWGVDIDAGAIDCAKYIAAAKKSNCKFDVFNVENGFKEKFDYIIALNVLHRVENFHKVCINIFNSTSQLILEIGEIQLEKFIYLSKKHNFSVTKIIKSHRISNVVGQRLLLLVSKK